LHTTLKKVATSFAVHAILGLGVKSEANGVTSLDQSIADAQAAENLDTVHHQSVQNLHSNGLLDSISGRSINMDQTLIDSSHLCPKCHTLHFRNVNEIAPGREVYPQGDEAEEPFRSDWAEFHDVGLPYLLPIHNSFDELEQSAQRGCHFCLQILYSFSPDDVTEFHSGKNAGTTSRKVWLEYREGEKDVGRSTRKVLYVSCHRTIRVLELLPRGEQAAMAIRQFTQLTRKKVFH
jgi:hypothetical protein